MLPGSNVFHCHADYLNFFRILLLKCGGVSNQTRLMAKQFTENDAAQFLEISFRSKDGGLYVKKLHAMSDDAALKEFYKWLDIYHAQQPSFDNEGNLIHTPARFRLEVIKAELKRRGIKGSQLATRGGRRQPHIHEVVKEMVNSLKRKKHNSSMDEIFHYVAAKMGKSFEATKKAYYYVAKKSPK